MNPNIHSVHLKPRLSQTRNTFLLLNSGPFILDRVIFFCALSEWIHDTFASFSPFFLWATLHLLQLQFLKQYIFNSWWQPTSLVLYTFYGMIYCHSVILANYFIRYSRCVFAKKNKNPRHEIRSILYELHHICMAMNICNEYQILSLSCI